MLRPSDTSVGIDEQGAIAELAVALALGLPWSGRFVAQLEQWLTWRHANGDIGSVEVRSTRSSSGHLLLQPGDKDGAPYLLAVVGPLPRVRLAGWLPGHAAKSRHFWRDLGPSVPRACYWVPQCQLRPIGELAKKKQAERSTGGG